MARGPAAGPIVELRLLGRFVVLADGAEVPAATFGGRKVRALLRMLAVQRGRLVPVDVLTEWLWPDRAPADPPANLQVLVNRVRRAVLPDLVITGTAGYALTEEPWCVVDLERFAAELRRARSLDGPAALQLYQSALVGSDAEPLAEDRYARWADPFREEILQLRQAAWERGAGLALAAGQPALAVEWAAAAVRAEPLREAAALALVRGLAAAGDRVGALARYDTYRRRLADELGLDPSPEAAQVQEALLQAEPAPEKVSDRGLELVALAPLRFVGRDRELAVIATVLSGRAVGRRVVRVAGRSGTGKSRLLAEIGETVPATYVRAFWADRDEPWTLARGLLGELVAVDFVVADALPDQLRTALASLLPDFEVGRVPIDPETRRALVLEAGVRVAGSIADLVIMVDDLQWADPISLRLLAALVDRLPGLGLVAAYRPDEIDPVGDVAAFLGRLDGPLVRLDRLGAVGLHDLVADPALCDALARSTDGTAMAVTEVLRRLAVEGVATADAHGRWRPVVGDAVERVSRIGRLGQRRAIVHRVAACPAVGQTVLRLLALLGRAVPARTLAAAVPLSEPAMLDALAALATADLVCQGERGWDLAHDMVAEVVSKELAPADRARWQGRLAAVLEDEDGDPAERARLWAEAGDAERAVRAYAAAARAALDEYADAEAERLADAGLDRVATAAGRRTERSELLEIRAHARQRRGALGAARADLQAALEAYRTGRSRSRVLADLTMLALGADDLHRAAELAELAVVEAGSDPAAAARALEVASVTDMNLGRSDRAEERAASALQRYSALGDSAGAARILDARAMATFLQVDIRAGTELLDRAAHLFEDSGDLMRTITPRSTRGHGLVLLSRAEEGLADATRALDPGPDPRASGGAGVRAVALRRGVVRAGAGGQRRGRGGAGADHRRPDRAPRVDGNSMAGHRSRSTGKR